DCAGHKLCVEFRPMDFLDIDVNLAIRALLDIDLQFVDFRAFATDDDSRPGRVDRDAKFVRHPLHLDVADAGVRQLLQAVAFQLQIFMKQPAVITLSEPAGPPRLRDSETKSVRVCLLTHYFLSPSAMVM